MGNQTIIQKIRQNILDWIWNYIEALMFKRVLKRHGIELGEYYMEDLIDMYKKSK